MPETLYSHTYGNRDGTMTIIVYNSDSRPILCGSGIRSQRELSQWRRTYAPWVQNTQHVAQAMGDTK